jgi:cellulose synthase/poly-beta-1,6-N-acetylglucosamine synthase-like glycosyltransferase
MIFQLIFWLSVFLLFHSYLFYPIILSFLSRFKKENQDVYSRSDDIPFISVIISAFNEEKVIREKIESIYKNAFPAQCFEVLVGSDASSDGTVKILHELQQNHGSLKVMDFRERRGKGNVVNDLVHESKGEILILTDANVMFDTDTIFEIVKHFKNPRIGLVDTNMINRGMKVEGISHQEKAYISREVRIKNNEGKLMGAMMGPFGGCYAIRKVDYEKVPANYLVDDFYINMRVFEKGRLAINNLEARVFEDIPDKIGIEFRRKVRIGTGNWQNLRAFSNLLWHPRYGFAFWSHKVLRWLGPFLLIIAFITNLVLAFQSEFYLVIFLLQCIFYVTPLFDFILKTVGIHFHLARLVTHFLAMNAALLIGFFRSLRHVHSGIWERTDRG